MRRLHAVPLPPWPGPRLDDVAVELDRECALLYANVVLRAEEIRRDREIAEAAPGDAMLDLAIPTLGHEERLDDLLAGYGSGADRDVIRAW